MKELVEIKKNEIFCDSHMVANKFGYKHAEIVRRIKNLEKDLSEIRVVSNHPKFIKEEREYRGQKYTSYLMNREFFSLLAMRFRSKKAFEWQVKFNSAFYDMERKILELSHNQKNPGWLSSRALGKVSRENETTAIKDFVEYATNQGSKNAKFYYKHITNATYKALNFVVQKYPKIRDILDVYELSELTLMERYVTEALKEYMGLERHYKDIYKCLAEDLKKYADGLRIDHRKKQIAE